MLVWEFFVDLGISVGLETLVILPCVVMPPLKAATSRSHVWTSAREMGTLSRDFHLECTLILIPCALVTREMKFILGEVC